MRIHISERARTCSPVSLLRASFTFPMLPAPIVFPRSQGSGSMTALRVESERAGMAKSSFLATFTSWGAAAADAERV
ncbi:hypothetical protein KCU99_g170, partial [Aureobasidium melanogenum]